jgi:hypothetical protein
MLMTGEHPPSHGDGDLSIVWANRWLAATVLVRGTITTAGPALAAEYPGLTVPPPSVSWAYAWRAARPTRTRSTHYNTGI